MKIPQDVRQAISRVLDNKASYDDFELFDSYNANGQPVLRWAMALVKKRGIKNVQAEKEWWTEQLGLGEGPMTTKKVEGKKRGKLSEKQKAYRKFFKDQLKDEGVDSPAKVGDKSQFFKRVKKDWAKEKAAKFGDEAGKTKKVARVHATTRTVLAELAKRGRPKLAKKLLAELNRGRGAWAISEDEVNKKMKQKGYRFRIDVKGKDLDPLFTKTMQEIGPLVREVIPNDKFEVTKL